MTKADPLGGAQLKIIRAHEHLNALKRHVAMYLDTKPYTFPSQMQGDLVVVGKAVSDHPPHLDIGLIIGDCLGTLMAPLDYIVWELASKHAGRPLEPPPSLFNDKPSFPIYADPVRYKKLKWADTMKARYHVPDEPLTEVELVQPYHAGYEPLALLYRLINQDKHRFPVLMIQHIDTGGIHLSYGGIALSVVQSSASMVTFKAPADVAGSRQPVKMDVDFNVTAFVAFDDPAMPREPVEVTLENILKCVEDVFIRFHQFFV